MKTCGPDLYWEKPVAELGGAGGCPTSSAPRDFLAGGAFTPIRFFAGIFSRTSLGGGGNCQSVAGGHSVISNCKGPPGGLHPLTISGRFQGDFPASPCADATETYALLLTCSDNDSSSSHCRHDTGRARNTGSNRDRSAQRRRVSQPNLTVRAQKER